MAPYRITLWDERGTACREIEVDLADDDAAIDRAGSIDHPHAITVRCDGRQVAEFAPAWRPTRGERGS